MSRKQLYPFGAVVGQEEAKEALLLSLINPRVQGVLLSGAKGTAKSSLVRSLVTLDDSLKIVEVPLNTTEDRLVGGIDLEKMLQRGEKVLQPGILAQAHGHVLYIDEINLLPPFLVKKILDAAATGVNRVEREGISLCHQSRFVLVGTMNPEEGELSPQLLDRFGLYVEVKGIKDEELRKEIVKRRLVFEENPAGFLALWQEEGAELARKLKSARRILPEVKTGEEILGLAAELAQAAGSKGHRGELVMVECARALAAWDGRKAVTVQDVKKAAAYALPHRQSRQPGEAQGKPLPPGAGAPPEKEDRREEKKGLPPGNHWRKGMGQAEERKDNPEEIVLSDGILPPGLAGAGGKGRGDWRGTRECRKKRGRYAGWTYPRGKELNAGDVALDATLRAAALCQPWRKKEGGFLKIEPRDFREKIRENPPQHLLVFVVDASGSMGARARMGAVKGALLSLLKEAYRKRQQVALVAFRQDRSRVLLPPTPSPERAQQYLAELATGGKTPLAEGLLQGLEVITQARRKNKALTPILILVSDGRCNWAREGQNPLEAALNAAGIYRQKGIISLVLDTEEGAFSLGLARRLAEVMGGRYVRLEEVSHRTVKHCVTCFLHEFERER
ncbi:MAG: VWA domain-containing protein [Bacillota bacterium]